VEVQGESSVSTRMPSLEVGTTVLKQTTRQATKRVSRHNVYPQMKRTFVLWAWTLTYNIELW